MASQKRRAEHNQVHNQGRSHFPVPAFLSHTIIKHTQAQITGQNHARFIPDQRAEQTGKTGNQNIPNPDSAFAGQQKRRQKSQSKNNRNHRKSASGQIIGPEKKRAKCNGKISHNPACILCPAQDQPISVHVINSGQHTQNAHYIPPLNLRKHPVEKR